MDSFESVLLVKNEIFVFKIPPRTSNRAYRAADWNLEEPQWSGRMRLVSKGNDLIMKLEDKATGELFAKCPIEAYPGIAIEAVSDSSRYFVIKIQDDNGRSAYIGLGFGDRSDSFDFNVALQDHFKWLKKTQEEVDRPASQDLNLGFKEGETIKINMKITKKDGSDVNKKSRLPGGSGSLGVLPPPPTNRLPPPPSPQHSVTPKMPSSSSSPNEDQKAQQDWVKF